MLVLSHATEREYGMLPLHLLYYIKFLTCLVPEVDNFAPTNKADNKPYYDNEGRILSQQNQLKACTK